MNGLGVSPRSFRFNGQNHAMARSSCERYFLLILCKSCYTATFLNLSCNFISSVAIMLLFKCFFSCQGQAVALINYGNALDSSGDFKGALKAYQQAYE